MFKKILTMRHIMAFGTQRDNRKPMLFGITFVVVIISCFLIAQAQESCWMGYFACFDGTVDSIPGLFSFRKLSDVSCIATSIILFSGFGLAICSLYLLILVAFTEIGKIRLATRFAFRTVLGCFAFLALPISFHGFFRGITFTVKSCAYFATIPSAKWVSFARRKVINRLNFFATKAFSHYRCIRHWFFLTKTLFLESSQIRYLCDSLYSNRYMYLVKEKSCD